MSYTARLYTAHSGNWISGASSSPFNSAPDSFVIGTTKPTAANTGIAATGLSTGSLAVVNGDLTIDDAYLSAKSPLSKLWVKGSVLFTASTAATLTDCYIEGPSGFTAGSPPHEVCVRARSTSTPTTAVLNLTRCTITCKQPDVGLSSAAGERLGTLTRCDISLGSDGLDWWSNAPLVYGCYIHDFTFWAHDPKHTNDPTHPGWSHNDAIQFNGNMAGGYIVGNNIVQAASTSYGDFSTLSSQYDANGYWGRCVIMTPNAGNVTGLQITDNWMLGGDSQVYLAQQSGGAYNSGNSFTARRNRHSYAMHHWGPYGGSYVGNIYVWDNGMTAQTTTDVVNSTNLFDTDQATPANLRGTSIPPVTLVSGANQYKSSVQF